MRLEIFENPRALFVLAIYVFHPPDPGFLLVSVLNLLPVQHASTSAQHVVLPTRMP
jgi:hypothetical protein